MPHRSTVSVLALLTAWGCAGTAPDAEETQVAAVFLSFVVTLMPSFLFSGFLFPIFTMPYVLQLYTYFFPARYFNDVSRDLFLKGVGIEYVAGNMLLLGLYGAALVAIATLRLRKKVA